MSVYFVILVPCGIWSKFTRLTFSSLRT